MRWVGLLAVVVIAAACISSGEHKPSDPPESKITKESSSAGAEDAASGEQKQSTPSPVTVIVKQENTPSHQSDEAKDDENIRIQRKLANLTAGLVWVGLLQAVILGLTVLAVFRQTGVARSTERAWVLAEAIGNPLDPIYSPNNPPGYIPGIVYRIKIAGTTPAKIIRERLRCRIVPVVPGSNPPQPQLEGVPEYGTEKGQYPPTVYAPGYIYNLPSFLESGSLTEEQWVSVRDKNSFLVAYGRIDYEDVFGKKRISQFCSLYNFVSGGVITSAEGIVLNRSGFRMGGPEAYNQYT